MLDTEPAFPMGQIELANIGQAPIRLHAKQFVHVDGLSLRPQLHGTVFCGFLLDKEWGGQAPSGVDELPTADRGIADDRPHLIGVHLIGGHQVDEALGVQRPLVDPILVLHAVEVAHGW